MQHKEDEAEEAAGARHKVRGKEGNVFFIFLRENCQSFRMLYELLSFTSLKKSLKK